MPLRKLPIAGLCVLVVTLLISACQPAQPTPAIETPQPVVPTIVPPTPTATLPPPRSLVVCLGSEPSSLYLYGGASPAMWSILEAVYDGPFDTRDYAAQPVILEKLPSIADGSASIQPVTVRAGDEVVNSAGQLVNLEQGTTIYPAGCNSADCAVQYDGSAELQMDQLRAVFKLLPGITWSDGAPLTAHDSVFSFQISADANTPVSKRVVERTAGYEALDDQTAQWTGKPGYLPARYFTNFWLPLPKHQLEGRTAADLLTAAETAEKPLGWGAYIIEEWVKGDHITLRKNPAYFRAAEGLPEFDNLVYRFLGEQGDANIAALLNGECDVVDQTSMLDEQIERVRDLQNEGKIIASIGQGPEWEQVVFGIRPASYDNLNDPNIQRRPNFFGDVRVRQAFAYCMDREIVHERALVGMATLPDGYLAPDHPLLATDLVRYPYDVAKGSSLLDEAGWKDIDNDPATPRVSLGVAGLPYVADGTPLEVTYLTTRAKLREDVSRRLAESMAACGIKVNVQNLSPEELYASGPSGPLFGRSFDLAQFSWQADTQSPCYLYETVQIPTAANRWVGANVGGYSSPDFDLACQSTRSRRLDAQDDAAAAATVQRLFAQELPAVPLYFHFKIAAARPDLCGLDLDTTTRSALWNLEALNYGEGCP